MTQIAIIKKVINKISSIELEKMLKKHDWWHDMSDDSYVWHKGRRELKEIAKKLKEMEPGKALEFWNSNCPENFKTDLKGLENIIKINAR